MHNPLPSPDVLDTWLREAAQLQMQGRIDEAAVLLRQLLAAKPDHAESRTRLGFILCQQGQTDDAIAAHRAALEIDPRHAGAWSNLAIALQQQDRHDEAFEALQQSLAIDPDVPETHVVLGIEWSARGQPSRAAACHRRAIALAPQMAEAWISLGVALQECGDLDAATAATQQGLRMRPGERRALSNLQLTQLYDPALSLADLRRGAAAAGAQLGAAQPMLAGEAWREGSRRLRVGIVSGDLYSHPVGWLGARSLLAHDRHAIELHVYSHTLVNDAMTQSLRNGIEHWHEVQALNDAALRDLILSHGIDVLIDTAGHTAQNRMAVFARRAAPTQLSWLGFPASTGLAAMDGVLLGAGMAPVGCEESFTERVLRSPGLSFTYQPPDYAPNVAPPPVLRKGVVTFGSFNNATKLNAGVLQTWAQLLHRVPDSRLVLKWRNLADPELSARIGNSFAALGIDPARVERRGPSRHPDMLAEYADIDIALDPFPFPGGLTTCEAMWMGVPVVTLPWQRPISRQGLAILQTMGLNELVANTPREYVEIAAQLAADTRRLQTLRNGMRERMAASPLFDGAALARALESVWRELAAAPESHA